MPVVQKNVFRFSGNYYIANNMSILLIFVLGFLIKFFLGEKTPMGSLLDNAIFRRFLTCPVPI